MERVSEYLEASTVRFERSSAPETKQNGRAQVELF